MVQRLLSRLFHPKEPFLVWWRKAPILREGRDARQRCRRICWAQMRRIFQSVAQGNHDHDCMQMNSKITVIRTRRWTQRPIRVGWNWSLDTSSPIGHEQLRKLALASRTTFLLSSQNLQLDATYHIWIPLHLRTGLHVESVIIAPISESEMLLNSQYSYET